MKTLRATTLFIIGAALLMGCGDDTQNDGGKGPKSGQKAEKKAPDAIPIRARLAKKEAISSLYASSTTLRAKQRAIVVAKTEGIVRTLVVEEGSQVQAGDSLAYLEADEQKINHNRARLTAEARHREYKRQKQLHERNLTSDMDLELARSQAEDATQAQALAKLTLDRTTIRAPFTGTILRRYVDVGVALNNGSSVFDLADLSTLYADVNIPERHVSTLETGQAVKLVGDASNISMSGVIERMSPEVDSTTGTIRISIAVPGNAALRPGAFVGVEITTSTHDNAIVVPRSALVAEGRRWYIYTLNDDQKTVSRHEVKLGYEQGDRVEIAGLLDPTGTLSQLKAGALVASVGAPSLSDGASVSVHDDGAEEASSGTP